MRSQRFKGSGNSYGSRRVRKSSSEPANLHRLTQECLRRGWLSEMSQKYGFQPCRRWPWVSPCARFPTAEGVDLTSHLLHDSGMEAAFKKRDFAKKCPRCGAHAGKLNGVRHSLATGRKQQIRCAVCRKQWLVPIDPVEPLF